MIYSKEHTIDVGAHRDAPPQVNDKSDQNLVKIFLEITLEREQTLNCILDILSITSNIYLQKRLKDLAKPGTSRSEQ